MATGGMSIHISEARNPNNPFNVFNRPPKEGSPKHKQSKAYKPSYIDSASCLGRCLYNVPSGTLIWLIPGLCMLVMGIIMVVLDKDGSWFEGILQAGIILLALGGSISIGTMLYCGVQWRRQKPKQHPKNLKRTKKQTDSTVSMGDTGDGGVQLVGIYRIKGHDNKAYAASSENVRASSAVKLDTVPEDVVVVSRTEVT